MNLKIYEYIIAIAEERSISRAAERFYLTEPVLSRHLRKIEEDFGQALFTRDKSGMHPTPAGVIFINNAQAILHMQDELKNDLDQIRLRHLKHFQVMVDSALTPYFAQHVPQQFQAKCPEYQLSFTNCNSIQAQRMVKDGRALFGLYTAGEFQDDSLNYLTVYSEPLLLIYPKQLLCTTIQDISKLHLNAVLSTPGTTLRMQAESYLVEKGIVPSDIVDTDSFPSAISLVKQGSYFSVIPLSDFQLLNGFEAVNTFELHTVYGIVSYSKEISLYGASHSLLQIIASVFSEYPKAGHAN